MHAHTCRQTRAIVLAACLVLGTAHADFVALSRRFHTDVRPLLLDTKPNVHNCSRHYFNQTLDHFTFKQGSAKWPQKYLIYDGYRNGASKTPKPIFFYAGNEDSVDVYVNFTGLMWELGKEMDALLVFAEHRYYGESQPVGPGSLYKDPSYLSIEQALADFATLIYHVKETHDALNSPVIAFGGSYGGMLAAWLRAKYPNAVQGAIAGSAPVGAYVSRHNPDFNPSDFWEVVTYDASPEAGAAEHCRKNVRSFFQAMLANKGQQSFWQQLADVFKMCQAPESSQDVENVAYWVQGAFDSFAMGNYPYPSTYMGGALPAWPMRAACERLAHKKPSQEDILQGMAEAVGLLYNATRDQLCYNATQLVGPAGPGDTWLFQWCTERAGQELPFYPANGRTDMFWDQGKYDEEQIRADCMKQFNVSGSGDWPVISLGGFDFSTASNIVFSNGEYDPWRIGGITRDISDTVVAVLIEEGAHHLDLMFSHPDDPPSVINARLLEAAYIKKWVQKHTARKPLQKPFGIF